MDSAAALRRLLDPASVRRIVVFRALMLGDLLCATPALRALRAGFPDASITLVGLPWAADLAARLASIDRFVEFPGYAGLPERVADTAALPGFLSALRAERFDLAVQLHGSGRIVNPLVAAFGARHTAAFAQPGDFRPDPALTTAWPAFGHEIERLLQLIDTIGVPRRGTKIEFPLDIADVAWRTSQRLQRGSYVIVHPGAQLPSRRWPVERFAEVAAALVRHGQRVVITGSADEAPLAHAIATKCAAQIVDLTGRTTLWQLGALVEGAALVVANDTGISHIAAAFATPSVIVSCGSDPARWAPLDRQRHRVLAAPAACRPCAHIVCPTQHECAVETSVDDVLDAIAATREPAHA